jgi:hypothetical protein
MRTVSAQPPLHLHYYDLALVFNFSLPATPYIDRSSSSGLYRWRLVLLSLPGHGATSWNRNGSNTQPLCLQTTMKPHLSLRGHGATTRSRRHMSSKRLSHEVAWNRNGSNTQPLCLQTTMKPHLSLRGHGATTRSRRHSSKRLSHEVAQHTSHHQASDHLPLPCHGAIRNGPRSSPRGSARP